jgi:hypothetical protein
VAIDKTGHEICNYPVEETVSIASDYNINVVMYEVVSTISGTGSAISAAVVARCRGK